MRAPRIIWPQSCPEPAAASTFHWARRTWAIEDRPLRCPALSWTHSTAAATPASLTRATSRKGQRSPKASAARPPRTGPAKEVMRPMPPKTE